jgi:hypothetical protein
VVLEAPAFFQDEDGIALFGQAHGGDGAPEAGADDDKIAGFVSQLIFLDSMVVNAWLQS